MLKILRIIMPGVILLAEPAVITRPVMVELTCQSSKPPQSNLENIVASFSLDVEINDSGRALYFDINFYKSNSINQKTILGSANDLSRFVQNGDYDVVAIYQMNGVSQPGYAPSAIIYVNRNVINILYDFNGTHDLINGSFESQKCFQYKGRPPLAKALGIAIANIVVKRLSQPSNSNYQYGVA